MSEQEAPKLVIHKLCGQPVFYYFGTKEDAEQLRNFDEITTLEGDAIVPEDIAACTHCGAKIRITQIQIAVHERKVVNNIYTDEPVKDEVKKMIEDRLKRSEEMRYKRERDDEIKRMEQEIRRIQMEEQMKKIPPPSDFFWLNENDPKRIRKDKTE